MPLTWQFTGSGVIGHRPGAAASAMTGVKVADVISLAQADSRGHLAASTGPNRKRCRPASFVPMNVSGTGSARREVTQPTDTRRARGCPSARSPGGQPRWHKAIPDIKGNFIAEPQLRFTLTPREFSNSEALVGLNRGVAVVNEAIWGRGFGGSRRWRLAPMTGNSSGAIVDTTHAWRESEDK